MSHAPFRVVPLDSTHNRNAFDSGSAPLNRYLHEQVTQDVRRRVTACFVALNATHQIAGYYTLASASVLLSDLPAAIAKRLPRYPTVPAVRMGRLAIDQNFKGKAWAVRCWPMPCNAPHGPKSRRMRCWWMPRTPTLPRSTNTTVCWRCPMRH